MLNPSTGDGDQADVEKNQFYGEFVWPGQGKSPAESSGGHFLVHFPGGIVVTTLCALCSPWNFIPWWSSRPACASSCGMWEGITTELKASQCLALELLPLLKIRGFLTPKSP